MQICDFGKAAIIERAIIRILQLRKNCVRFRNRYDIITILAIAI